MNDKIQNNLPLQNKQTSTCFEITSVTCTAVQQKLIPKSISKSWLFPVVLLLELLGGCCMFVKLWCMQKARGFIVPEHFWTFFSSKERLITKIQSQFPKFIFLTTFKLAQLYSNHFCIKCCRSVQITVRANGRVIFLKNQILSSKSFTLFRWLIH